MPLRLDWAGADHGWRLRRDREQLIRTPDLRVHLADGSVLVGRCELEGGHWRAWLDVPDGAAVHKRPDGVLDIGSSAHVD